MSPGFSGGRFRAEHCKVSGKDKSVKAAIQNKKRAIGKCVTKPIEISAIGFLKYFINFV
jgi:hypothetical protein